MRSLFAYGTLQLPEVLRAVTGRVFPGVPARLDGYRCCRIRERSYPGVRPWPGDSVPGLLYFDLPDEVWGRLDDFEDEFYRRCSLPVTVDGGGLELAEVYVVAPQSTGILLDEVWDLEQFRERSLQRFLRDHS